MDWEDYQNTSESYEIYKKEVPLSYNGEKLKNFEELPPSIKKGWKAIDDKFMFVRNTTFRIIGEWSKLRDDMMRYKDNADEWDD